MRVEYGLTFFRQTWVMSFIDITTLSNGRSTCAGSEGATSSVKNVMLAASTTAHRIP